MIAPHVNDNTILSFFDCHLQSNNDTKHYKLTLKEAINTIDNCSSQLDKQCGYFLVCGRLLGMSNDFVINTGRDNTETINWQLLFETSIFDCLFK